MKTPQLLRLLLILLRCLLVAGLTAVPGSATQDPLDELFGEWEFEHVAENGEVERGVLVFWPDREGQLEAELVWLLDEGYQEGDRGARLHYTPLRFEERRLVGSVDCEPVPDDDGAWWRRVEFDVTLAEDGSKFEGNVQTTVINSNASEIFKVHGAEATWRRRPLPRVYAVAVRPLDFERFDSGEVQGRWASEARYWPQIQVVLRGDELPLGTAVLGGLYSQIHIHDEHLRFLRAEKGDGELVLTLALAPGTKGGIKALTLAGADVAFQLPLEGYLQEGPPPVATAVRLWMAPDGARPYVPNSHMDPISTPDRAPQGPPPLGSAFSFEIEFDRPPADDVQAGELLVVRRGEVAHRQDVRGFRLAGDAEHFYSKPIRVGAQGRAALPQVLPEDRVIVRYGQVQAEARIGVGNELTLYAVTEDGHLPVDRVPYGRPLRAEWRPVEPIDGELVTLTVGAGDRRIEVPARRRKPDGTFVADTFVVHLGGGLGQETPAGARAETAQALFSEPDESAWRPQISDTVVRTLRGRWDIQYTDAELGIVTGWAVAEDDESVRVFLRDPRLPDDVEELVSSEVRWERDVVPPASPTGHAFHEGTVYVTLEGYSPEARSNWEADMRGAPLLVLPEGVSEVLVTAPGLGERAFALHSPLVADGARVQLRLELDQRGDLAGEWAYRADAVTKRNAYGGGRTGSFEPAEDALTVGVQRGQELWTRGMPERLSVIVLDEIEELRELEKEDYQSVDRPGARHLLLVGEDLPATYHDVFELGSMTRSVNLVTDGLEYMYLGREGARVMPNDKERLSVGIAEVRRRAAERGEPLPEDAQYALVYVDVPAGAESGQHAFRLNGSLASWILTYADNLASAGFAQGVDWSDYDNPELQLTEELFVPQRVQVMVETNLELPQYRVDVEVVHLRDGEILEVREQTLQRSDQEPCRFHSLMSLGLVPEGETADGNTLAVRPGDELVVRIGSDPFAVLVGGEGRARVVESSVEAGGPWTATLERAAACKDVSASDANVLRKVALTRSELVLGPSVISAFPRVNLIPGSPFTSLLLAELLTYAGALEPWDQPYEIEYQVTVGDHAAMLLLRDEFAAAIQDQINLVAPEYRESDEALNAKLERFRLMAVEWIAIEKQGGPEWPLGGLLVPGPGTVDLGQVELRAALDHDNFMLSSGMRKEYERQVMLPALELHVSTLQGVVHEVQSMDSCAVDDLLLLTGYGFLPIVERLLPKLVRQDDSGQWIPDVVARSYVTSLATLGAHALAVEDLSELDDGFLVAVFSLVAWPAASAMGVGRFATWAVVDLGFGGAYFAAQEYPLIAQKRDEARFAADAFAALGRERALTAAERLDPSWAVALSVGGAVLGTAALPVSEVVSFSTKAMRVAKSADPAMLEREGTRLLQRVNEGGPEVLAGLNRSDKTTLAAFLVSALDETSVVSDASRVQVAESVVRMRDMLAEQLDDSSRRIRTAQDFDPLGSLDDGLPGTVPLVLDPTTGKVRKAAQLPASEAAGLTPWQRKRDADYSRDLVRDNALIDPSGQRIERGPFVGSGAYATAHDAAGGGVPKVLKAIDGAPTAEEAKLVAEDVLAGQALLEELGIPQVKNFDAELEPVVPYMYQRKIGTGLPADVAEEFLPKLSVSGLWEVGSNSRPRLAREASEAVLDLVEDLVRGGAVWTDLKPDNFVFQRMRQPGAPGPLRVAVVDQDRIAVLAGGVREGSQLELFLQYGRAGLLNGDIPSMGGAYRPPMSTPAEVMFRVLEHRKAIQYDPARGWVDGWLNMKAVQERFEALEGFGKVDDYIRDPAYPKVGQATPLRLVPSLHLDPVASFLPAALAA